MHGQYDDGGYLRRQLGCRERHRLQAGGKIRKPVSICRYDDRTVTEVTNECLRQSLCIGGCDFCITLSAGGRRKIRKKLTFFSFCFRKKKIHVFQNRFLYGIIIKSESWECMNFLILSPQFPATNWNFCDRLKLNGINTLGIGYEPYEELRIEVRHALQDYIQIQQYQSYDAALRAAAFFTYRYGRINGMESFQEGRLFFDARLRTDFHVESGCTVSNVQRFLDSGTRRAWIRACGVPITPARRALSLPQAQELLSAQKHGALYNVQKEQLYAYEDAKKLADAWKYGCQQLLVPKLEGSLYIWEALLDHTGASRATAAGRLSSGKQHRISKEEEKELTVFAQEACAKLCANEWSCGFLHMLIWKRQGHWELLDIRSGADRCVLLKEYPDIYQLWADGMCEEMERASAQKK